MNSKRVLYLALVVVTLSIGVMIGTILTGGAAATTVQKAAPLQIPPLPDPSTLSNAFAQIADQVGPAVVTITTQAVIPTQPARGGGRGGNRGQTNPALPDLGDLFGFPPLNPDTESARSVGTGFIVDKAGFILTNHHVIEPPENGSVKKITVQLEDKAEYPAKLIGSDKETDLAVIKIDVGHDLPIARFGNSDAVRTGDWVLAIGSPFQFDHSVTAGIISAKGRDSQSGSPSMGSQFQSFLQTDAAINPGNSGGPLVNMRAEVIGINTAIVSQSRSFAGLGFALPSNSAVNVYNQLTQSGKVTRGYLGIQYATEQEKMLRTYGLNADGGVIISEVVPGEAASKGGLKPMDIITQIGMTKITSTNVLLDVIANSSVGSSIQVKVLREGKELNLPITVGDRAAVDKIVNNVPEPQPPAAGGNRGGGNQGGRGGTNRGGQRGNQPAPGGRGAAPVVPSTPNSLGLTVQSIDPNLIQRFGLESDVAGVIVTGVQSGSVADDAGFRPGWVITRVVVGGQTTMIRTTEDYSRIERSLRSGADVVLWVLARTSQDGPYSNRPFVLTMP